MSQTEQQMRLDKLKRLKEEGTNPYPSKGTQTHFTKNILDKFDKLEGQDLILAGRLMILRSFGKLAFGKLQDKTGTIQLVFENQNLKKIDSGDIIEVQGKTFVTKKGENSVLVENFKLLSKTLEPLPEKWHGIKDEETRYRKRYLDIAMNPELQEMFRKKTIFWQSMRQFLIDNNFQEVETPVLEATPGGADAEPFTTHHNALDIDLYLRISMGELWQKRLMVAGLERTFEIGRQFRNEGIDAEHLQDYTQMEFYMAYANYEDGMKLTEKLYKKVLGETFGTLKFKIKGFNVDLDQEWGIIDYKTAIQEKFDIDILKATDKEIKEKCLDKDIIGRGRMIDHLWKQIRKEIAGPAFLINHPVEVSPLAKRKEDTPELVERFQIIIAGSELGNGYSELNDPLDQEARFEEQAKLREAGDAEAQMHDEEFVDALKHGMPPTCGFGLSERVFAFFMDKPIRECVLFPLLKPKHAPQKPAAPVIGEKFTINPEVKNKFPDLKIGYSIIQGVEIKKEDKELNSLKEKSTPTPEQAKEMLDNLPVLEDYRQILKATKIDPTSKKPSPIALLDRIQSGKPLYTINTLVDAVNLVVMKYGISFGAFDLDKIKLPTTLRFSKKGEEFLPILEEKNKKLKDGELIYSDQEKIICRGLNYRDSEHTKITDKTKNIILFVDGTKSVSQEELNKVLKEAQELIIKFCGKKIKKAKVNINRDKALELLKQHVKDPANINHSLESEVVMRGIAKNLGEDEELWGLTGLLHDLDWEETGEENPKEHGVKSLEYLADYPEELKQAIQAHNYDYNGATEPTTKLDYALRAGETVTGLIYASTLVRPDKKIASVKVKSIKKKLKDKSFAAKVSRDTIKECEKLDLEIDKFLQISLESMQSIADEIGL